MDSEKVKATKKQISDLFNILDKKHEEIAEIEFELRDLIKIYSREEKYIVPLNLRNMRKLIDEDKRI